MWKKIGVKKMIDEKKLIEELKNHPNLFKELGWSIECIDIDSVIETINEQPKADWIPCENETPKTNGVYQTVRKVIEGDTVYYLEGASYFDGQNTWHNDIGVNHGREYPNVVAWQPIQPYKKEGAE